MGNSPPQHRHVDFPPESSLRSYDGFMVGRNRHGAGTLVWKDGARYEGDWVANEMAGNGILRFPNGSTFQGSFSHNNPNGRGTLTTINNEQLTGSWQFQGRGHNNGPVGKYLFSGEVYEPISGKRQTYVGPLTLHQTTGLVALPGMSDPTAQVMPYATVVGATAEEGRKILHEALSEGGVPQAKVVESAPSGIAFGYQDPALRPRHPDDHATVDLADPRTYLEGLGINPRSIVGAPANTNAKRQAEIRAMEAASLGGSAPPITGPGGIPPTSNQARQLV